MSGIGLLRLGLAFEELCETSGLELGLDAVAFGDCLGEALDFLAGGAAFDAALDFFFDTGLRLALELLV